MVTAIVSAYRSAPYLDARLVNIADNPAIDETVVVCQSGSPDHKIASSYEGITVITTDDVPTLYRAWNMAIRRATSDYLIVANADDRYGNLRPLVEALNRGYDIAYGDQDIYEDYSRPPVGRYTWREGGLRELLQGCYLGPMPMWRRSLHDEVGYFDESYHVAGDYDFWLRLAIAGKRMYHVREVVGDYLRRPDSLERREPVRTLWETARARAAAKQKTR